MKFWDSSALVPLLVPEVHSATLVQRMHENAATAVWWAAPVECVSALGRLEREGRLSDTERTVAIERLTALMREWTEIPPTNRVRDQAVRLLRLHPLRAADALHLAAAIVLAEYDPRALPFVTLDRQLAAAASREGFDVLGA